MSNFKERLTDAINAVSNIDLFFEGYISNIKDLLNRADAVEDGLIEQFNGIELKLEESYGGEDQGSSYYTVYSFKEVESNEVLYVKFDGYYASYVGSEFHDWFYVEPKEEVVINYYPR